MKKEIATSQVHPPFRTSMVSIFPLNGKKHVIQLKMITGKSKITCIGTNNIVIITAKTWAYVAYYSAKLHLTLFSIFMWESFK